MYLIWLLLSVVNAIQVNRGLVRVDEANFRFDDHTTLNLTDSRLSFGFTLVRDAKNTEELVAPDHVALALSGPNTSFKQYFSPRVIENKVFEVATPISSISPWLLNGDYINVELITGDSNDAELNSMFGLTKLYPSIKLQQSISIKEPIKHEAKPEIYHIFRESPKSVMKLLIFQFMFEISLCLAVLIGYWLYADAWNVKNASNVSPLTYPFIATIIAIHYVIFDYYKQASIFQTIGRVAILAPLAIFFGAKSLKSIYKLQIAGLR